VSSHDVYSTMRIMSVTSVTVDKWYGYGHLKEIVTWIGENGREKMDGRKWTKTDKRQTHIMIKKIDEQMLERRVMRSFKKFVGGREYGTAIRLLQRTI
ncbi:hypothetical protein Tco_0929060, partial [Tanacetum coccineum]